MMSVSQTVRFCYGCNQKIAVSGTEARCPYCGQPLVSLGLAPTVDLDDVDARETYVDHAAQSDRGTDDPLVGKRLATYQIESFLGKGGMARVYRAMHLTLERPCAIKVLSPERVGRNPDWVQRFFAEARAAAALSHPHVVTIHNIGCDDGLYFIEMEYVVGRSLQRLLEESGRLGPVQATDLMRQTCSALGEAHRRGMVHRDIKPANIMVTAQGVAKLADFGLAKRVVGHSSRRRRAAEASEEEGLMGTPYFMAPELFEGQPASKRSDVYAMGITYFYLLTGRLPFVGQSVMEVARKHAQEPIPSVSELQAAVPPEAAAVLQHSLAKSPEDRYPDAATMYADLRAVFGNLRDLESLVSEALAGLGAAWRGSGPRFEVDVGLPDGRAQRVYVEATTGLPLCDRLVRIYSVCAPLAETYYRRALELNSTIRHGSIAIEQVQGRPHFIVVNTYPRATCDPEEIRQSVLSIARWADDVERALVGGDRA